MADSEYRGPSLEERGRQRSFERTNQYGSYLAPASMQESENEEIRFETKEYVVLQNFSVIFKR